MSGWLCRVPVYLLSCVTGKDMESQDGDVTFAAAAECSPGLPGEWMSKNNSSVLAVKTLELLWKAGCVSSSEEITCTVQPKRCILDAPSLQCPTSSLAWDTVQQTHE